MRTDVRVITRGGLRCPNVSSGLMCRPTIVGRGDYIKWAHGDSHDFTGRVIGHVQNPDDNEPYLVVNMLLLSGSVCERWVKPADVIDTCTGFGNRAAMWMYSDNWNLASTDTQRKAMELSFDETGRIKQ